MHSFRKKLRNLLFCVLPALSVGSLAMGCEGNKEKVQGKKKGKEEGKKKKKKKKGKKKKKENDKEEGKKKKKKKGKKKKKEKNEDKKKKGESKKDSKKKKGKKKGSGKKKTRLAERAIGKSCVGEIQSCTQDHASCKGTNEECKNFALTCLNELDLNCLPGVPTGVEIEEHSVWVEGLASCIADPDMHDCISDYDECVNEEDNPETGCFQALETCMAPLFEEECSAS